MADFAADKEALQQTLAVFDKDIKVEKVLGYSSQYEPYQSTDVLFLQTVLEVCCSFVEPNPHQRKHLFTVLEKLLVREKIISPNIQFDSLLDIRRKSAKQFILSLNELRSSLIPSPKDSISIPNLLDADPTKKYFNTYEENFEELRVIAEGGFGTVCMARHKVDGLIYAIKKIIFKFEREKDFTKVMNEVKSISTLSHKNIVSYKNCWIQLPYNYERTGTAEEDSSGSPDSISQKFSANRRQSKKVKSKCDTLLNFAPDVHSTPCSVSTLKSLDERCLYPKVLDSNHKKRVSFNKSSERWTTSTLNQMTNLSSIFEQDSSSILCDSRPYDFVQDVILNQDIVTDSCCNNPPADSPASSAGRDRTCKLEQSHDSSRSTSASSSASCCHSIDVKSSGSNSSAGSCESNPSQDEASGESDDSVIFSNSYWNDPVSDTVGGTLPDAGVGMLSESKKGVPEPAEGEDHSTTLEAGSDLLHESFGNDSTSILGKGDFDRSIAISRCKTSFESSWSVSSSLNQVESSFSNDSALLYESTRRLLPLEHPFKFKLQFRAMLCIQMEYCDCDLRLWLDQRAKGVLLPFEKEVKDIFKEIVKGVSYIHSKSIIHRDLKPQNIFYSEKDSSLKIGDFGLATLGHSSSNRHRNVKQHFTSDLGTYPYAAPEQMKKNNYNNKVDIYSLGIILIELLLPFQTHAEFFDIIQQIASGDLPKELTSQWPCYVDLVKNLVQKRPSHRMTAKEILDLPIMEDDAKVDRRQLLREISDLKKALENKDKEHEEAINVKNAMIENLRGEVTELREVVKWFKSKKPRKKH